MRAILSFLFAVMLSGCTIQKPLPDNKIGFYGPIARNLKNVPGPLRIAICADRRPRCLANPGEDWNSIDVPKASTPTATLVWVRRMGSVYLVKIVQGGSNIDINLDAYEPYSGDVGFHRIWSLSDYQVATGRSQVPRNIDPRIARVVRAVFQPANSCLSGIWLANSDCPGSERWPFS
jgi:hypothetical protein